MTIRNFIFILLNFNFSLYTEWEWEIGVNIPPEEYENNPDDYICHICGSACELIQANRILIERGPIFCKYTYYIYSKCSDYTCILAYKRIVKELLILNS